MKFANNIVGIIVATPLLSKIITACTASSSARNVTSGVLWTQSARNLFGALMWSSAAK